MITGTKSPLRSLNWAKSRLVDGSCVKNATCKTCKFLSGVGSKLLARLVGTASPPQGSDRIVHFSSYCSLILQRYGFVPGILTGKGEKSRRIMDSLIL